MLLSFVADNHNALAVASLWAPVVAVSCDSCFDMALFSLWFLFVIQFIFLKQFGPKSLPPKVKNTIWSLEWYGYL